MDTRIYPAWDVILASKSKLTSGEMALLTYLDRNLPSDWQIFSQPFMNGQRPDIVVFNPNVGVMIYEVKDWDLGHYKFVSDDGKNGLVVMGKDGEWHRVKNPVDQVQYYAQKLTSQLVPQIGELIDVSPCSYGVIKQGLYFHNATSDVVSSLFSEYTNEAAYRPILGRDDLVDDRIASVVPDAVRQSSHYWKEAWNNDVLLWMRPPYHSIEQTRVLLLTDRQRDHAAPRSGHSRLRGPAGSGKSLVIAYRAGQLAAQGKSVLILTFNITLWHYIRDLIQRTPFEFEWDKITFNHFHGFCGDILNKCGREWPRLQDDNDEAREGFFRTDVVTAVRKAVDSVEHDRWDAVMIDEGQDYCWEWYDLLSSEFMTSHNELLLVCDNNQNVYGRETSWIEGAMTNVQFRGQWRELKGSHRMSLPIAREVSRFAREFQLQGVDEIESSLRPEQGDFLGRLFEPQMIWIDRLHDITEQGQAGFLWHVYEALKMRRYSPSDVVVLLPSHELGASAVQLFEERGVGVNHVFDVSGKGSGKRHKKSFWNGDGRLKMSTIQSFKGWEAQCVVLLIDNSISSDKKILDMAVYTAMTRAREVLVVVNCSERYIEFGASIPRKWSSVVE